MKYHKLLYRLVICCCLLVQFSCRKFAEVESPYTSTTGANVYNNDATAISVLTGIYINLENNQFQSGQALPALSLYGGLSADELSLMPGTAGAMLDFYTNQQTNTTAANFWQTGYPVIYILNSALEGVAAGQKLTPAVKQQLTGEAKFMRAFYYFYLTNLYGDVPLVTGTDYKVNSLLARSPQTLVYDQIVKDLLEAQQQLSSDFVDGTLLQSSSDRLRPTSWAATALLARVYLYRKDYNNAALQATKLISNTAQFSLVNDINGVFLSNSSEAIWQLQPVLVGFNTQDALNFVLPSGGPDPYSYPVFLSPQQLASFEPGDKRAVAGNWVQNVTVGTDTYFYAFKYKSATLNDPLTEYEMVLRLGEQYLIRAEAEANGAVGGITAAITDLNKIRQRAGLPAYNGTSTSGAVLTAIYHERQTELFTEWGNRWLDLKRTNVADQVMPQVTQLKGGSWKTASKLYPIAASDLLSNPNLVQNVGY